MHKETEVFWDKTPCRLVKSYLRFEEFTSSMFMV